VDIARRASWRVGVVGDCAGGAMREPAHPRFDDLPAPQQAGILCNDPEFQKFAAIRSGLPEHRFTPTAAAEYLRACCKIKSRTALLNDPAARDQFAKMRTSFDGWRGRIANQR
tara:strand:- start:134 stop:472 length:339 start_codon:yes stop_codon:yes gene_type:complete